MSNTVSQDFIEKMSVSEMHQENRYYFTCESSLIEEIAEKNSDALAIWVYLTNKPKEWRIYPEVVKDKLGIGRRRYAAAIAVLKEVGVVRQKSIKGDEAGQFAGKVTFISNYRPNPTKAVCSDEIDDQRNLPEAVTVNGSDRQRSCRKPVGTITNTTELPISRKQPTALEKENPPPQKTNKAIMPKLYELVAEKYLHARQSKWPKAIEFSKSITVCHALASMQMPDDPDDPIHDRVIVAINKAVSDGEYTSYNRKPITSAIESALLVVRSQAEKPEPEVPKLCAECNTNECHGAMPVCWNCLS